MQSPYLPEINVSINIMHFPNLRKTTTQSRLKQYVVSFQVLSTE